MITNNSGLPEALVNAVRNDSYSKGDSDYSVTELLKPPRQNVLQKRHAHEIEEDAEDKIYSLYGQIVHLILERANETGDIAEKRFSAMFGDKKVSAQIDSLSIKDGVVSDWKFVTSWKFKAGKTTDESWTAQLNMQLEILRQNGHDAKAIQIVGLLRDFSKNEARRNEDYPKSPVVTVPIEVWPREKTVAFINMRISLHEAAKTALPECSTDERWAKPDIFAVMKGKRAIPGGLQFSAEAAHKMSKENPGTRVEFRKGESMRCELYCSASAFCSSYQKTLKEKTEESQDAV